MSRVRQSTGDRVFDAVNYTFLLLCGLGVLYPLLYIVSASFSSPQAVVGGKVVLWPVQPSLLSYRAVFKYIAVLTGYLNSLIYAASGTVFGVLVTFLAAYPLARRGLYGRNLIMGLFVFTMLFSGGLIPTYLTVRRLGLVNTRLAMVVPGAVSVWNIIIMRTFFQSSIPQELFDAAEIDGASELRTMFTIVMPLSGAIFAVVVLNFAVWLWNSYFTALIYLRDASLQPLQIILRQILILNQMDSSMVRDVAIFVERQSLADVLRFSLIVVASAPLLMAYPFVQKYFIRGIMIGAIKG
jgi:putative aldouronate transport system permease protein